MEEEAQSQEEMPLGQGTPSNNDYDSDSDSDTSLDSSKEEDEEGIFSLTPKEVRSKKKKKKREKKKKEVEKKKKKKDKESEQRTKKDCSFFLKGNCCHGFLGKKKIEGKSCPFNHPMLCKKYLNNGTKKGGCNKRDCENVHPRMCEDSLKKGRCQNVGRGVRCPKGYHTKMIEESGENRIPEARNDRSMSSNNSGISKDDLKSIFGEFMREEVIKLREEWEDSLIKKLKEGPKPVRKDAATVIKEALGL